MREVKRMLGHSAAFSIQIARLLCLGIVVTRLCASAQGTFQNLDFEQGSLDFLSGGGPFIATTNALPGWTVYANGTPQQIVSYDQIYAPCVAGIADSLSGYALDGRFSAILGGIGLVGVPVSIAQSGMIPADSESLRFLSLGEFSLSFAGHSIPLKVLGNLPYFGQIYGADISAYAGECGLLTFQTGPLSSNGINILDDITFSTQPVPEPGVLSILGLGVVMLFLRSSGRGVCSPTNR